jgi:hypothetical protein
LFIKGHGDQSDSPGQPTGFIQLSDTDPNDQLSFTQTVGIVLDGQVVNDLFRAVTTADTTVTLTGCASNDTLTVQKILMPLVIWVQCPW